MQIYDASDVTDARSTDKWSSKKKKQLPPAAKLEVNGRLFKPLSNLKKEIWFLIAIIFYFFPVKEFAKWMRLCIEFYIVQRVKMSLNQFQIANTGLNILMVSELHLSGMHRLHY